MPDSVRFLDMLGRRRKPFGKEPYGAIDALVFSNMAGMPLRGVVEALSEDSGIESNITVKDACKEILAINKKEKNLNDDSKRFLEIMARNPRYRDVELCAYLNTFNKENVTGISAVTAVLPKNEEVTIAFAGTGAEIERWIENLRLLYAETVPAQKAACEYTSRVAEMYPGSWIHLAGYSKGDRFATEAAMNLSPGDKKRLASLYCVDGPGFNEFIAKNPGFNQKYTRIKNQLGERMRTLSPEKMIVGGLLMDMPGKTRDFFQTDGEHFLCHDLYNFRFKDGDFAVVEGNKVHPAYRRFCEALQKTLMKFSFPRRVLLVNSLECVIRTHGIETFAELATVLQKPKVIESIGNLTVFEKTALTTFAANLVTNIKRERFDYTGKNPALKVLNTAKKAIFGNQVLNIIPNIIRVFGVMAIVADAVNDTLRRVVREVVGFFKKTPKEAEVVAAVASRRRAHAADNTQDDLLKRQRIPLERTGQNRIFTTPGVVTRGRRGML